MGEGSGLVTWKLRERETGSPSATGCGGAVQLTSRRGVGVSMSAAPHSRELPLLSSTSLASAVSSPNLRVCMHACAYVCVCACMHA